MPRYTYKCKKCEKTYEVTHMMSDTPEGCFLPACDGALERLPPGSLNFARTIQPKEAEAGDLVKSTIEETKEYLRNEKVEAGKRIWKPS